MNHTRFLFFKLALLLVSTVFFLLCITPAHAYYFGNGKWKTDGYIKSAFGVFTDKKPFNKAKFGGCDDNISTATQVIRWDTEGQLSSKFSVVAQVQAIWEPEYPSEKNVVFTDGSTPKANYYNSFDWRELTIEYKPSWTHSFKFGRQIINWGEALSGRVIDQCNPADTRRGSGVLGLDEYYMPLWMFRGQHDFANFFNTSFEWVIAPIWQADRYETSRGVSGSTAYGDGSTGSPQARWAAQRDQRVNRLGGADWSINYYGSPTAILGAPWRTGYHGTDLLDLDGTPGRDGGIPKAVTGAQALTLLSPYANPSFILSQPADTKYIIYTETPYYSAPTDYTDHNFKNTRWGFKTKSLFGEVECGISFFQGPGGSQTPIVKYIPTGEYTGYIQLQTQIVRYNTYGVFANIPWHGTKFWVEAAYQPDRRFQKDQVGIGWGSAAEAERLNDCIAHIDQVKSLWGISREQWFRFLNPYNTFAINFQYTNTYRLDDTDGVTYILSYFNELPKVEHSFVLSVSTAYSYNKYLPNLTVAYYPEGAGLVSAGFTYLPEGFNARLSLSANYTAYLVGPEFCTAVAYADHNDAFTFSMKYKFY